VIADAGAEGTRLRSAGGIVQPVHEFVGEDAAHLAAARLALEALEGTGCGVAVICVFDDREANQRHLKASQRR
jgi:hypothetical protein